MPLDLTTLRLGDATSTEAIIATFASDATFASFASAETKQILERDAQDAEKLSAGISAAIKRGVLEANPPVEEQHQIDVLGKTVDDVVSAMKSKLPPAGESCIIVLSGLSGTGKGTTVAALQSTLERSVTWSNGNVFRSLTWLALEHCTAEGLGDLTEELLTPELLGRLVGQLEFGIFDGKYDTLIHPVSGAAALRVSEVQNTLLKESRIGKAIPLVAKMSQGQVVKFAAQAAETMRADGCTVIIEGRQATLDYVRTPYRFELTLSDPSIIGMRRASQRVMADALQTLGGIDSASPLEVHAACALAIEKLAGGIGGAGDVAKGTAKPAPAAVAAIEGYCTANALQAKLAAAIGGAVRSQAPEPRLAIAAGLLQMSDLSAELKPLAALLGELGGLPPAEAADRLRGDGSASAPSEYLRRQLELRRPAEPYADSVMRGHVMKCDEFDSIHLLKGERPHPCVWNYRQAAGGAPIFGVGQCHVDGIRWLVADLAARGYSRALMLNMREEPVVFLGGKACAPRVDGEELNENICYLSESAATSSTRWRRR